MGEGDTESGPSQVGVCLSGGGVRAAAFALGAVQGLQEKKGLLYGPQCADLLAAVSGGSYTAAASTIQAKELGSTADSTAEPPLAPGTAEAEYIIKHGRYLAKGGWLQTGLLFLLMLIVNLAALPLLFIVTGGFIGALAWGSSVVGVSFEPAGELATWLLAVLAVVSLGLLLVGRYRDGGPARFFLWVSGLLLLTVTSHSLVLVLLKQASFSDIRWWFPRPPVWVSQNPDDRWWKLAWSTPNDWFTGSVVVALALCAAWGVALVLSRSSKVDSQWLARLVVGVIAWWSRWAGFVMVCVWAGTSYTWCQENTGVTSLVPDNQFVEGDAFPEWTSAVLTVLGVLLLAGAISYVTARVSLHRVNRDRIASTFAVHRDPADPDRITKLSSTATLLSTLKPPETKSEHSFPQLVICATMNIHRYTDARWRRFEPFHFSHDVCGTPAPVARSDTGEAKVFITEQLEKGVRPVKWWQPGSVEPAVSLMTAVACTGAAASPAMGRFAGFAPAARTILTLLNIRLGTWLPNPVSDVVRGRIGGVEAGRTWKLQSPRGLGGGYDEFVPELVGLHFGKAPRAYLSDGGHYDNLGLLALLRRRCKVIWCVDSQADKEGKASQLRDVFALAESELNIAIDLDLDGFTLEGGATGQGFAIGTIHYEPRFAEREVLGTLIVIKLEMSPDSPQEVLQHRTNDPQFPAHSTFTVIAFGEARMRAYVALGRHNAVQACQAFDVLQAAAAETDQQARDAEGGTDLKDGVTRDGTPPAGLEFRGSVWFHDS